MKWFMQRNNKQKIVGVTGVCLLVFGVFYFKRHHTPAVAAIAVSVASATQGDLTPQIDTIGTAVALHQVDIKSQVSGQLAQIPVKSGQVVSAGDTLFIIDQAPFKAALDQALAIQAKDHATAGFASQQLNRYSTLAENGYVSKDFFAQVLANAKSAKAALNADSALVETAKLQLDHCTINAPINGRLGDIVPNVGDLISANATTSMVSIKQFQPIHVQFSLASKDVSLVWQALHNQNIQVSATSSDDSNLHARGTIDFVDNQIDATTGSIIMKARFLNEDSAIWPGQLVQIRINGHPQKNVILIPTEAIAENQQGDFYVYSIDQKHRAHLKTVRLGASVNNQTAILAGISKGELIVTQGQFRLNDGALVSYAA